MKRSEFLSILTGSLATGGIVSQACSPAADSGLPDASGLVDTPEKRKAYLESLTREICALGPHPIGSPEMARAAAIVKREMERSLPEVGLDEFPFERWVLKGEPRMVIGERVIETCPAHGTSGTGPGGLRGTVRNIEDPGGIPFGVFDDSGELRAWITPSRYGLAVPLPYYSFDKQVGSLPTFNVGLKDLGFVELAAENGAPVFLRSEVEFVPGSTARNVVGTLPGGSDREIVYLAHLDTVYNSPGANDNTASVAAMLMLAHALSGRRPADTLTFVATTGEEYDKLGAIHYVDRRRQEGTFPRIRFLVNLDSVTWGPNMKLSTADEMLVAMVRRIDRELGLDGEPVWDAKDGFMLDARPFRDPAIRALYVNSEGYDLAHLWHRPEDTPETVPLDCAEIWFRLFREYTDRIMEL